MSPVFVFVCKSVHVSIMVLRFLTVMHPEVDMEVVGDIKYSREKNPRLVIAIAEEAACAWLLERKPRLISAETVLLDMNEILTEVKEK